MMIDGVVLINLASLSTSTNTISGLKIMSPCADLPTYLVHVYGSSQMSNYFNSTRAILTPLFSLLPRRLNHRM